VVPGRIMGLRLSHLPLQHRDDLQEESCTMVEKASTEAQDARREAVRRAARAAASAAGKEWKKLSQEERKAFRVQARKSLNSK
jgi:hypothetical protein